MAGTNRADSALIRLWNTATARSVGTFSSRNGEVTSMAFSPDGSKLAGGHESGGIRFWNLR